LGFNNLIEVIMNSMMKGGGVKQGGAIQKALVFWGKWNEHVLGRQN
jgi:hypothetical protein